ncbi:hypothetical protein [Haloarcula sp. H-GB5]
MSTNTSSAESSSTDTKTRDIESGLNDSSEDISVGETSEGTKDTNGVEEHKIQTEQQMQFGDNGSLEPAEETVETTLGQFDVEISHRDPDTRLEQPKASGIMRDDRPEAQSQNAGEQTNLLPDVEDDQITLDGDSAQDRTLFKDDD